MDHINKEDLSYLIILYFIFKVMGYYSKLFQIIVPAPIDISAELYVYSDTMHIRCRFDKVENSTCEYTVDDMPDILNDFLQYSLLPFQNYLHPYFHNLSEDHYMESLYAKSVEEDADTITVDFIYVDRPEAYNYIRTLERSCIL